MSEVKGMPLDELIEWAFGRKFPHQVIYMDAMAEVERLARLGAAVEATGSRCWIVIEKNIDVPPHVTGVFTDPGQAQGFRDKLHKTFHRAGWVYEVEEKKLNSYEG